MDTLLSLVNRWQRGFPLVPSPFAAVAGYEGKGETKVIEAFAAARKAGWMARLGPVWAPRRLGWSTLAAARVPPDKLDAVAECVSIFPEVNHNYAREDEWNLWFVITSPSESRGRAILVAIERALDVPVIALPLRTEFFVDLGFDLTGEKKRAPIKAEVPTQASLSAEMEPLVHALSAGLPLVPHPYAAVGEAIGWSEPAVIASSSSGSARGWCAASGRWCVTAVSATGPMPCACGMCPTMQCARQASGLLSSRR